MGRVCVWVWGVVAEAEAAVLRRLSIERDVEEDVKVRWSAGVEVPLLSDAQVGLRFVEEK